MKKNLILLSLLVFFCLVSCSGQKKPSSLDSWMSENGKIKVLSTVQMVGDIVQAIAKDRIDHTVLIQGELDPHTYELVKGDAEKLCRADIIFYNGLGLEHGASLSHYLLNCKKGAALGEKIHQIDPSQILRVSHVVDPHIWMDVSLWKETVPFIVAELCKMDPEGQEFYLENAEALQEKLLGLHEYIQQEMKKIDPEKRFLVTSHDAFNYFARRYLAEENEDWRARFAAPEGIAPEGQLSPIDIKKIVDYLLQHQVKVIFPESNLSQDSLKKIQDAAKKMGFAVQVSEQALFGDACPTGTCEIGYIEMMRHNAEVISTHLRGNKNGK